MWGLAQALPLHGGLPGRLLSCLSLGMSGKQCERGAEQGPEPQARGRRVGVRAPLYRLHVACLHLVPPPRPRPHPQRESQPATGDLSNCFNVEASTVPGSSPLAWPGCCSTLGGALLQGAGVEPPRRRGSRLLPRPSVLRLE